jgi:hypothetical protein
MSRLHDVWRSFRSLPSWVQAWVGLCLVPVNLVPYAMLGTATGRAAALAMTIVILTNLPILLAQRGMSRLLSLPHLLAWGPLCLWLAARLATGVPMNASEAALAWLLLIVNTISLGFDAMDSLRWWRGDRAVAGASPSENNRA